MVGEAAYDILPVALDGDERPLEGVDEPGRCRKAGLPVPGDHPRRRRPANSDAGARTDSAGERQHAESVGVELGGPDKAARPFGAGEAAAIVDMAIGGIRP